MGSPKALLEWRGETFLGRLARIHKVCDGGVIVVVGHGAKEILAAASGLQDAKIVVNPHPELGQLSSLQCGLAALPPDAAAFLFTPVDHAPVSETTVARLLGEFEASGKPLAIPRCRGRRGHPVLAVRSLADELLALPADSQARVVIHKHLAEAQYVDVDDPATVEDVDDLAAYARLLERSRQG
jgi:CTP:molybdopterin cytidylyltransferase MocA